MSQIDIQEQVELDDVYDEEAPIKGTVSINSRGVLIAFDGYQDYHGADNILIENQNGIPHVVVWASSGQEDPTHVISLENAKVEVCKKCGTRLTEGFCEDETCPYSDRKQEETYTEG